MDKGDVDVSYSKRCYKLQRGHLYYRKKFGEIKLQFPYTSTFIYAYAIEVNTSSKTFYIRLKFSSSDLIPKCR